MISKDCKLLAHYKQLKGLMPRNITWLIPFILLRLATSVNFCMIESSMARLYQCNRHPTRDSDWDLPPNNFCQLGASQTQSHSNLPPNSFSNLGQVKLGLNKFDLACQVWLMINHEYNLDWLSQTHQIFYKTPNMCISLYLVLQSFIFSQSESNSCLFCQQVFPDSECGNFGLYCKAMQIWLLNSISSKCHPFFWSINKLEWCFPAIPLHWIRKP